MRHEFLSHTLATVVPTLGGCVERESGIVKAISRGESSNSMSSSLQSHWGTHIDAPRHFSDSGPDISSLPADSFIFTAPGTIHVSLSAGEILGWDERFAAMPTTIDLLLIKSEWSTRRDHPCYHDDNPGLAPELASALRHQFPQLRAVGIDWLSISANSNRTLGREAHRAFLSPGNGQEAIVLIEDMDLSQDLAQLTEVFALPLRITDFDSGPCTVIGRFND